MANKQGKNEGYSYRVTKSGKIECRAYFDMPDGTRKQLGATATTEDKARKKLTEKFGKICKNGKQLKIKNYTVKSWCNYWLFDIKKGIIKGNTFDGYVSSFENYVYPVIGKKFLKDLTLSDIQEVINKAKKRTVIKKGKKELITGKTVKENISPLLQALEFAINSDLMPYINFKGLSKPKVKKGSRPIRNKNEQQIVTNYFLNKIPEQPFNLYYAPIVVMDARGIRPEECAGIQWKDINFEKNTFWVGRHTVVKNNIYDENNKKIGSKLIVEDSGKTEHAVRELQLGNFLSYIFHSKYQEYVNKGITPKSTDFVFVNSYGNLYYEQSLREMYKSLARKLGIEEFGCYSLRHEFATYLGKEQKRDRATTKQLMGWSKIIETYFHTDEEDKNETLTIADKQYESAFIDTKQEVTKETVEQINYIDNIVVFPISNVVNK